LQGGGENGRRRSCPLNSAAVDLFALVRREDAPHGSPLCPWGVQLWIFLMQRRKRGGQYAREEQGARARKETTKRRISTTGPLLSLSSPASPLVAVAPFASLLSPLFPLSPPPPSPILNQPRSSSDNKNENENEKKKTAPSKSRAPRPAAPAAASSHRRGPITPTPTTTAAAPTSRRASVAAAAGLSGKVNKVVLAYSGGLDTSVILAWLQETYGCEVVTFTADLGQGEELEPVRGKAAAAGVKEIFIDDLREEFVRDFVFPMFRANALYEGTYLLGTSIARPLIARRQIEIAREVGADAVSHGATGKGNDQVTFRVLFCFFCSPATFFRPALRSRPPLASLSPLSKAPPPPASSRSSLPLRKKRKKKTNQRFGSSWATTACSPTSRSSLPGGSGTSTRGRG